MTWWRIGDEDIVECIERKGDHVFDMAEYFEKEVTKASRELHKIIGSLDPIVRFWPFVITWLNSNVALGTRDSKLIWGSLGFLCRYYPYFASRYVVCLHTVQILGVFLGWIPRAFECPQMSPRLVRNIYAQ